MTSDLVYLTTDLTPPKHTCPLFTETKRTKEGLVLHSLNGYSERGRLLTWKSMALWKQTNKIIELSGEIGYLGFPWHLLNSPKWHNCHENPFIVHWENILVYVAKIKLLGHRVYPVSVRVNIAEEFFTKMKQVCFFHITINNHHHSVSIFCQSDGCKVVNYFSLICISLITNELEDLFIYLIAICVSACLLSVHIICPY